MNNDNDIEKYEIGYSIFEKLFLLKKHELLNKMYKICPNEVCINVLSNDNTVYKEIIDDVPRSIKILAYDYIEISPIGIVYKKEYGEYQTIAEFNLNFII